MALFGTMFGAIGAGVQFKPIPSRRDSLLKVIFDPDRFDNAAIELAREIEIFPDAGLNGLLWAPHQLGDVRPSIAFPAQINGALHIVIAQYALVHRVASRRAKMLLSRLDAHSWRPCKRVTIGASPWECCRLRKRPLDSTY